MLFFQIQFKISLANIVHAWYFWTWAGQFYFCLMTFGCEFLIKCASLKVGLVLVQVGFVLVQVSFLNPDFLIDAGMELDCSCAQMKAENI